MSTRADALAERIQQGANALAAFAESLTDADWQTMVPADERSIGVLVHHVASAYPIEVDLTSGLAAGKPMVGVTWEMVDGMNAQHAQANASVSRAETLALLRQNSARAAEQIRQFTDEQLDTAAPVSLNANAPLTAQFFIEDHALRHSFHHLANIRAALGR